MYYCLQVFPIPLRGQDIPEQFKRRIYRIWLSLEKHFIGLSGDNFVNYIRGRLVSFENEDLKNEIEEELKDLVFLKPEQCCGDYIWCHLFCSSAFQKTCEFGTQACNFIIEKIVKKNTIPPQYDISMNGSGGSLINLKSEDLLQFNRFKKRVMERCNFVPVKPAHPSWDMVLNFLHEYVLEEVEIEREQIEEYEIGVIYNVITKWIERSKGDATLEALDAGMPIKVNGIWYATGEAIVKELERRGVKFSREDLFQKLKEFYKCQKVDLELNGEKRKVWKIMEAEDKDMETEQKQLFEDESLRESEGGEGDEEDIPF